MTYVAGEIAASGTVVIPASYPKGIMFFGTNFTGLNTIDTSIGTGIFMGFAGPDLASPGTIVQHAIGIVPDGDAYCADNYAILAPHTDGSGNYLYRASVTAMTDESVTVVFDTGSAGCRVYYLVIEDFSKSAVVYSGASPKVLGWQAHSVLTHSVSFTSNGVGSANFYHGATWGVGSYPLGSGGWTTTFVTASSYPTSIGGQGESDLFVDGGSTPLIGLGTHFIGPFMVGGGEYGFPTGTNLYNLYIQSDSDNFSHFLAWDGKSQSGYVNIPAATVAATADTAFTQLEDIEALIGWSVSSAPQGQSAGAGYAAGFSVATEDYQACAIVDGGVSRGAYQSNTKGWASAVSGTEVRAGTVEFLGTTVRLTTTDAGSIGGSLSTVCFEGDDLTGFFRILDIQ